MNLNPYISTYDNSMRVWWLLDYWFMKDSWKFLSDTKGQVPIIEILTKKELHDVLLKFVQKYESCPKRLHFMLFKIKQTQFYSLIIIFHVLFNSRHLTFSITITYTYSDGLTTWIINSEVWFFQKQVVFVAKLGISHD